MDNDKKIIDLEQRKALMVNLLKVLLEYCEKHGLKVYLAFGTLLGAVRHNGFIPWDDDADVMMPVKDWKKLMDCLEKDPLPEPYHLSTPGNNPGHIWPFLKLIDFRTSLVESCVTPKLKKQQADFYGIYVDIFLMYGLPDREKERRLFSRKIAGVYDALKRSTRIMNRRPADSYIYWRLRQALYFIYCLPNKLLGYRHYLKKMFRMMEQFPLNGSEQFSWDVELTEGKINGFESKCLAEEVLLDFETLQFPALAAYDKILKMQYGDYLQLPPIEQRRTHEANVKWRERKTQ